MSGASPTQADTYDADVSVLQGSHDRAHILADNPSCNLDTKLEAVSLSCLALLIIQMSRTFFGPAQRKVPHVRHQSAQTFTLLPSSHAGMRMCR